MPRALKFALSSLLIGLMSVGLAYAGAILTPPDLGRAGGPAASSAKTAQSEDSEGDLPAISAADAVTLQPGEVFAGAAKASITPQHGIAWNNDADNVTGPPWKKEGCATLGGDGANMVDPHTLDPRVKWAEGSGCVYSGGFGLGPMNPLYSFDEEFGLWARSVVISDGTDELVLTILDGAYYFAKYRDFCENCGFLDIANELSADLGIDPSGFMLASTHSHASPDFIGAWGGVPEWYMEQVKDAIKASIRAAYDTMRPARIEMGEIIARQFNGERRDFYRAAEEPGLSWFRLYDTGTPAPDAPITYGPGGTYELGTTGSQSHPGCDHSQGNNPNCPARAIATVASFAAHPVGMGSGPVAYADFPVTFAQRTEERFGGVGLFFQTGLGNMSSSGGGHPEGENTMERLGFGTASLLPPIGQGRTPASTDVVTAQRFWNQPVTNSVLGGLGLAGIFDRPFEQVPAAVEAGEGDGVKELGALLEEVAEDPSKLEDLQDFVGTPKVCRSASPVSVRTAVSAARIGELWITGAPGEIFSNYTNTIKEKNPHGVTMPLALVNDGLGYIMQSFETDHAGRQGLGFAGGVVEYEDAYSIDHCFGDMALEATLQLLGSGGTANSYP